MSRGTHLQFTSPNVGRNTHNPVLRRWVPLKAWTFTAAIFALTASSGSFHVLQAQTRQVEVPEASTFVGADRLSEAFRFVAKKLKPSVVTIKSLVQANRRVRYQVDGLDDLEQLEQFRGLIPDELFDELRRGRPNGGDESLGGGRQIQAGLGSGVIVSSDGYILTNNHVVARADALEVELSDGRTFEAEVVGTDEKSDVAVLRINASGLVAAQLGNSSAMQVGDWVIAVGSPFGLQQTVTAGIISATNRQADIISRGYEDFLQTDAAINPGNSGGPLVNLRGEVIGINTAINSRTGTYTGVGFAIPSNMAERIVEDLRTNGRVVRGFIGASLGEVTPENASDYQLPAGITKGAVVARVVEGEPADKARLMKGDVVIRLGRKAIESPAVLRNAIASTRPGTTLPLDVYRDGKLLSLNITPVELTDEALKRSELGPQIESLAIRAQELPESVRRDWDVEGGVVVTEMGRGPGYRLGLRPYDVILSVNGRDVESVEDLRKEVQRNGSELDVIVQRGNRIMSLSNSRRLR